MSTSRKQLIGAIAREMDHSEVMPGMRRIVLMVPVVVHARRDGKLGAVAYPSNAQVQEIYNARRRRGP